MPPRPLRPTCVLPVAAVVLLATAAPARAACFKVLAPRADSLPSVTFSTEISVDPACVYSPSPGGQGAVRLPAGFPARTDFASLVAALRPLWRGANAGPLPKFVFARPASGPAPSAGLEMLRRHPCTDSLLPSNLVEVRSDGKLATVKRIASNECGFAETRLSVVPDVARTAALIVPIGGPAAGRTLDVDSPSVRVPLEGARGLRIYAGRRGGAQALFLGTVQPEDNRTPLQALLGEADSGPAVDVVGTVVAGPTPATPPAFALEVASGRVLLRPRGGRLPAAEAQLLASARGLVLATDAGDLVALEVASGPGLEAGELLAIPDAYVRAQMAALHPGVVVNGLVPTVDDWSRIAARLIVCGLDEYGAFRGDDAFGMAGRRCVRGAVAVRRFEAAWLKPAITVLRAVTVMGPASNGGPDQGPGEPPVREPIAGRIPAPPVLAVGDTIFVEPAPAVADWQLCIDGSDCQPIPAGASSTGVTLRKSGIAQIVARPAGCPPGVNDCARPSPSGLAAARFVVIDPREDWQPVGLRAGRFADLSWEYDSTATLYRGRGDLSTALNVPLLANAVLPPGGLTLLEPDVPLQPRWHRGPPPHGSLVEARVSKRAACPTRDEDLVPEPAALAPEQTLYLHLGEWVMPTELGAQRSFTCIARAAVRVHPALSIASTSARHPTLAGRFSAGIGGQTWLGVATDGRLAGALLMHDLGWLRAEVVRHPVFGALSFEAAADLAASFYLAHGDTAEHATLGAGASVRVVLGPFAADGFPVRFSCGGLFSGGFGAPPPAQLICAAGFRY